ncbi:hypothetical protein M2169_000154 [Streptomyces sp. MJP52]|nr:hypothetical protein [Streptomyces sp. MJP52]
MNTRIRRTVGLLAAAAVLPPGPDRLLRRQR